MSQTDNQIMVRVIDGRLELFEELVRRHRSALLRAAVSKLKKSALAEDAVQDCFLSAFGGRRTFNPEFSFRGWLWTILLNVCRTQYRRETRQPETALTREMLMTNEPETCETGLTELLQAERSELLSDLLARLPESEADALRLRFSGELQFGEIAQAMNCSRNGVRTRVRWGLERLARRASLCVQGGEEL